MSFISRIVSFYLTPDLVAILMNVGLSSFVQTGHHVEVKLDQVFDTRNKDNPQTTLGFLQCIFCRPLHQSTIQLTEERGEESPLQENITQHRNNLVSVPLLRGTAATVERRDRQQFARFHNGFIFHNCPGHSTNLIRSRKMIVLNMICDVKKGLRSKQDSEC